MTSSSYGPVLGRFRWLLHQITASYWSLPVVAVFLSLPAAVLALVLDRAGVTSWLIANALSPVITADTAKDLVGVAVGINAAFLTLYFSITLLVLTVASSTLGVRLVDRWLKKRLVRVSLAGLCFTLIFSLAIMAAVDADAALADTPVAAVGLVVAFQAINVAMLSVALHDLGRTIFVDRSIRALAHDAGRLSTQTCAGTPHAGPWAVTLAAPQEGYIEGNDLKRLAKILLGHPGAVRICAAPGSHVLENEPLMLLERHGDLPGDLRDCIAIGDYRSDAQGAVFQVRLLVEIAARAMSPAVNDFYTALACTDRLTRVMHEQREIWIDDSKTACYAEDPRIELPGQDFRGIFDDPLSALRQSACDYPTVSIRMIGNLARLIVRVQADGGPPALAGFLAEHAREFALHGAGKAEFDRDRNDMLRKLEDVEAAMTGAAGTLAV